MTNSKASALDLNHPHTISVLSLDEIQVVYLPEHQYGIAKSYASTSVDDTRSPINILRAVLILCEAREYKTKIKLLAAKIKRLNRETFNNNSGSETNAILHTTNCSRT